MSTREACFDRRLYNRRISSDAVSVCREVSIVLDWIDHMSQLSTDDQYDIKVILCELLQNAVRHGNMMDRTKTILLDVTLDGLDTLEISVQDEGQGFDIERMLAQKRDIRTQMQDVSDLDEFGRGLLIVGSLCDAIHGNERGNRITVRKQMQRS
jgi:serine/threonine-protein kinase RsbW